MKKLVLLLAVAFSAALYSCANKAAEATEETVDTAAVEAVVEEVAAAVDTVNGDTTVVVAAEVVEAPAAE